MVHKKRRSKPARMVFSELPEELITDILVRLPVKSLVRFRVVHKSWNSLISSSTFIQAHLRRSQSRNPLLLVKSIAWPDRQLFSLHMDEPPLCVYDNYKLMDPPLEYHQRKRPTNVYEIYMTINDDERIDVVGSCNGLICLDAPIHHHILIWNPCISKHVSCFYDEELFGYVNNHGNYWCTYGFGYDSRNNDYKVVRVAYEKPKVVSCVVWSLKKRYWKTLGVDSFPGTGFKLSSDSVVIHGVVHWVLEKKDKLGFSIISFDISNEQFGDQYTMPEVDSRSEYVILSRYMNCLALFCWHFEGNDYISRNCKLDMWMMKEYGVVESWVKLFSIQLPSIRWIDLRGFRENGEAMFRLFDANYYRINEDEMKWLNPRTSNIQGFHIPGLKYIDCDFVEPFVESLVDPA